MQGNQQPRVCTRPEFVSEEAAEDAIMLAASCGLDLDPWQQLAIKVVLAESVPSRRWAAREAGLLVARQNGKNVVLEAIALYGLFIVGDPLTLWTAHQFKTTQEAFLRLRGWIDASDELRPKVKTITTAAGAEGVHLKNGCRLRFVARSRSSGRGFSPQRIIFDEAQELPVLAIEAMLPSLSAQPNPQVIFTGTVPTEADDCDYWTGLRDRGRTGQDRSLAWLEWSPEGSEDPVAARDLDLDEPFHWINSNPALGLRLNKETVEAERAAFSRHPESFARERLSVWPSGQAGAVIIPAKVWNDLRGDTLTGAARSFGVKFSPDGKRFAVAGAVRADNDQVFVEVINVRNAVAGDGMAWLADFLTERWRDSLSVVIDGRSGAPHLINLLQDRKVPDSALIKISTEQAIASCAGFVHAAFTGDLVHSDQPGLNASVAIAARRDIGTQGGWGFGPVTPDGDVTPMEAAALAHYGVTASKRKPGRKARVVIR